MLAFLLMLNCNLTLWEWDFNAILIKRLVDTFHDITNVTTSCKYIQPNNNAQCNAAIIKAFKSDNDWLCFVSDSQ